MVCSGYIEASLNGTSLNNLYSNIEEQLIKKFKELHLTSLMSAYTNNREDLDFLSQPLNKQLLTMLTQYEQMAKERRT